MAEPEGNIPDQTEAKLREELEQAIRELQLANLDHGRELALSKDIGLTTPDGAIAQRMATRRHREAVTRLHEALQKFEAFGRRRWGITPKR